MKFFSYKIFPERELIVEYYSGVYEINDLIHCKSLLNKIPNYRFDYTTIIDFRNTKLNFDPESSAFESFVNYLKKTFGGDKNRRVAYITKDPKEYVLTYLFPEFVIERGLNFTADCFSTIEGAAKWVGKDKIKKEELTTTIHKLETENNSF